MPSNICNASASNLIFESFVIELLSGTFVNDQYALRSSFAVTASPSSTSAVSVFPRRNLQTNYWFIKNIRTEL